MHGACHTVPDAGPSLTPAESPVKYLKPGRLADSMPIFGPAGRPITKLFARLSRSLRDGNINRPDRYEDLPSHDRKSRPAAVERESRI